MSEIDQEAFILGLSGAIESVDVAEPMVSEERGLVGSLAHNMDFQLAGRYVAA